MGNSREYAAKVELGNAIQRKAVSVNKQIQRLSEELDNMKTKAVSDTYTPANMADVTIVMSSEDKADMLKLGGDAEVKIRALADSLKAFIDSIVI